MLRDKVVLIQKVNFKARGKAYRTNIKKITGILANLNKNGCRTFNQCPKIFHQVQRRTRCLA